MAGLAGLREMHRRLEGEGVRELAPVSHGNALSLYFKDPEGNRIELFIDTPWYVEQPVRVPIDMKLPEAELWAWAERDARARAGFRPVEEWRAALTEKLGRSR
jgi:catechol-2,3-dioxygenase